MQVVEQGNAVVVLVDGEQCQGLWKAIEPHLTAGRRGCVLDLREVMFLNSVNIAAIISARNKAVAAGATLQLANVKDRVKSIFRVLKLDRLFSLDLDLPAAVQRIG